MFGTIRMELLKEKLTESRCLVSDATKTVLVYLAITGLLIRLAVDNVPRRGLFLSLSIAGVLTSLFSVFVFYTQFLIRRAVVDDLKRLNDSLGAPLLNCDLPTLKYISMTALLFGCMGSLGWVALNCAHHAGFLA